MVMKSVNFSYELRGRWERAREGERRELKTYSSFAKHIS
jgi:hypothetical protein